jgi:hypothetical protein
MQFWPVIILGLQREVALRKRAFKDSNAAALDGLNRLRLTAIAAAGAGTGAGTSG